jgi:hypothetical protein
VNGLLREYLLNINLKSLPCFKNVEHWVEGHDSQGGGGFVDVGAIQKYLDC